MTPEKKVFPMRSVKSNSELGLLMRLSLPLSVRGSSSSCWFTHQSLAHVRCAIFLVYLTFCAVNRICQEHVIVYANEVVWKN